MRLYLAGMEAFSGKSKTYYVNLHNDTYVLTSFYYCTDKYIEKLINTIGRDNILLDSGAFTFRMHGLKGEDIDTYTKRYIDFINKYNIKYFFEMDIDITKEDLKKVKELRKRIEDETGKQCIPVWHKVRGIDEWKDIVDKYKYIAIGGGTDIHNNDKKYKDVIKQMVKYANQHKVKVHGLGYNRKDIIEMGFYSADATSWAGGKYGNIWYWDNIKKRPKYDRSNTAIKRIKAERQPDVSRQNYDVWYHYQKYLRKEGYWHE